MYIEDINKMGNSSGGCRKASAFLLLYSSVILQNMGKDLKSKNQAEFSEIIAIIEQSRENAFRAVNHELISMYWKIGEYISDKVKNSG